MGWDTVLDFKILGNTLTNAMSDPELSQFGENWWDLNTDMKESLILLGTALYHGYVRNVFIF